MLTPPQHNQERHKLNIGIIGAGNIGATLARKLAAVGHTVKLANSKRSDSIQALTHEIGVHAVTKEQAVLEVDVVILSIPFANYPDLKQTLGGAT
ncbi:NAD(P)-binding domain-containing protein [Pseudomonas sp. CFBP 13727]|nr:NAD(P)-binding domain-containing protein [Pseudomonas sp. CFBP 8771]MBD8625073.1 NAD(P)-binding domain-containing protein [Pseudomonas sp. CFBP 13727]